MGNSNGGGGPHEVPSTTQSTRPAENVPKPVERASCQHMVQSNGTCGLYGCDNYGQH